MLDADIGVGEAHAGNQKEGATRQVGDTKSGGGDKECRQFQQMIWRGAGRLPKGGGVDKCRGPKGVGEATGRRGKQGRQPTNLILT